jgi:hypothetical protein
VEEVTQVGTAPVFASADEALDMVRAGLGYLAAADATQLGAAAQARCLKVFEQADAIATATRASFLAARASVIARPRCCPSGRHADGPGGMLARFASPAALSAAYCLTISRQPAED